MFSDVIAPNTGLARTPRGEVRLIVTNECQALCASLHEATVAHLKMVDGMVKRTKAEMVPYIRGCMKQ